MRKKKIQDLIDAVEKIYGPISLYGSNELEKYGTCFTLRDIQASFSVIMNRKTAERGTFNIQIESQPPGYYIHIVDKVSLEHFVELIEVFKNPMEKWPENQ